MAGSSVYGKGYYDGSNDTREKDLYIAGALLVEVGLYKVSRAGYIRLRQMQAARAEKRILAATGQSPDLDESGTVESPDQ